MGTTGININRRVSLNAQSTSKFLFIGFSNRCNEDNPLRSAKTNALLKAYTEEST